MSDMLIRGFESRWGSNLEPLNCCTNSTTNVLYILTDLYNKRKVLYFSKCIIFQYYVSRDNFGLCWDLWRKSAVKRNEFHFKFHKVEKNCQNKNLRSCELNLPMLVYIVVNAILSSSVPSMWRAYAVIPAWGTYTSWKSRMASTPWPTYPMMSSWCGRPFVTTSRP